jgi:hypothetical protein
MVKSSRRPDGSALAAQAEVGQVILREAKQLEKFFFKHLAWRELQNGTHVAPFSNSRQLSEATFTHFSPPRNSHVIIPIL